MKIARFTLPLLLLAGTAQADLSANLGFASEYHYRGIFQKNSSASGGLDYEAGGFYAGTWAADVGDGLEVDGYFGFPDADADATEEVSLSIGQEEREVTLPAKAGGWAIGDPVFWDGTDLVEASATNRYVGRVSKAVAAAGGVGWMLVAPQSFGDPVAQA